MKQAVENTENLTLTQAEIIDLRKANGAWEVVTRLGAVWTAKAVVICTGTYLKGNIIVGDVSYPADRTACSRRKPVGGAYPA